MTKFLIWITALLGLAPAILVAISTLVVSRLRHKNTDLGGASLQIGTFAINLNVSSYSWAAVMVLAGAAFVAVGLLFLLPGQGRFVPRTGFSKIELYIEQLLRSPSEVSSLIVATPDDQSSLLLMKEGGQTTLHVSIQRTLHPNQEARLRTLCREHNVLPAKEFLSSNGGAEGATISFEFPLGDNPKSVAKLCIQVLTDVFGATDKQGLRFIARDS